MNPVQIKGKTFHWGSTTYLCGILNMTIDSFSGDGLGKSVDQAIARIERMIASGVDMVDIGGESSRPGAQPIGVREEIRRVVPIIKKTSSLFQIPISIDTYKTTVAKAAFDNGADILNDITALTGDPQMEAFVAKRKPPVILMHMQGKPRTMQRSPYYRDVLKDVICFLKRRKKRCLALGLPEEYVLVDPGIGFGKTLAHNLALLRGLKELKKVGTVFLGPSRKSFLGQLTGKKVADRLSATCGVAAYAIEQGVDVLRVHDCEAIQDIRRVLLPLTSERGHTYYIGLGSNQGDRLKALFRARAMLEKAGVHTLDVSSVYETLPEGIRSKRTFYNQVLKGLSFHAPERVLAMCLEVEKDMGRDRSKGKGSRIIDLDLVHWDGRPMQTSVLSLPHPRASSRGFVLTPFFEVDKMFAVQQGWQRRRKGIVRKIWQR